MRVNRIRNELKSKSVREEAGKHNGKGVENREFKITGDVEGSAPGLP